jgi:RNA polymerase sigma factor (sigma-70 family)
MIDLIKKVVYYLKFPPNVNPREYWSYGWIGYKKAKETWIEGRMEFDKYAEWCIKNAILDGMRKETQNIHRKDKKQKPEFCGLDLIAELGQEDPVYERITNQNLIKYIFSQLNSNQEEILSEHFMNGLTLKEAGVILGITESAASLRRKAALKEARSIVEEM